MKKAVLLLVIFGAFTTMVLAQTNVPAPAPASTGTEAVAPVDPAAGTQPAKKHHKPGKGKKAKHAKHAKPAEKAEAADAGTAAVK